MSGERAVSDETEEIEPVFDRFGFVLKGEEDNDGRLALKTIHEREKKWRKMISNFGYYRKVKHKKVLVKQLERRCYKGIPDCIRASAWQELCGSTKQLLAHPGVYEQLKSSDVLSEFRNAIDLDLHRIFPDHVMFHGNKQTGQSELNDMLTAYANQNKVVGYCQAMGPVAALLLMYMPVEEAFWCLSTLLSSPLYLKDYYSPMLINIQVDAIVLKTLMERHVPVVTKTLSDQEVEPLLFMTDWFMCVYCRTLPWVTVLNIWDLFLYHGFNVIYRASIAILKVCQEDIVKLTNINQMMHYLRNLPYERVRSSVLIPVIHKIKISDREIETERAKAVQQWTTENELKNERRKVNDAAAAIAMAERERIRQERLQNEARIAAENTKDNNNNEEGETPETGIVTENIYDNVDNEDRQGATSETDKVTENTKDNKKNKGSEDATPETNRVPENIYDNVDNGDREGATSETGKVTESIKDNINEDVSKGAISVLKTEIATGNTRVNKDCSEGNEERDIPSLVISTSRVSIM